MRKEQEEAFWQTIKAFKEIGLLPHVMIIGSWAEFHVFIKKTFLNLNFLPEF